MRSLIMIASLAVLGGCMNARLLPAGVTGNETFVTVSNVWNSAQALPYAEKHCRQYGKAPRFKEMQGATAVFDCVKPDA